MYFNLRVIARTKAAWETGELLSTPNGSSGQCKVGTLMVNKLSVWMDAISGYTLTVPSIL